MGMVIRLTDPDFQQGYERGKKASSQGDLGDETLTDKEIIEILRNLFRVADNVAQVQQLGFLFGRLQVANWGDG